VPTGFRVWLRGDGGDAPLYWLRQGRPGRLRRTPHLGDDLVFGVKHVLRGGEVGGRRNFANAPACESVLFGAGQLIENGRGLYSVQAPGKPRTPVPLQDFVNIRQGSSPRDSPMSRHTGLQPREILGRRANQDACLWGWSALYGACAAQQMCKNEHIASWPCSTAAWPARMPCTPSSNEATTQAHGVSGPCSKLNCGVTAPSCAPAGAVSAKGVREKVSGRRRDERWGLCAPPLADSS
jgi:hypothetical protein